MTLKQYVVVFADITQGYAIWTKQEYLEYIGGLGNHESCYHPVATFSPGEELKEDVNPEEMQYGLKVLLSERKNCHRYINISFQNARYEDSMLWNNRMNEIEKAIAKLKGEKWIPVTEMTHEQREQYLRELNNPIKI